MSGAYAGARVRRAVLHFLAGKAGSAGLNFVGFLLVARLLPLADYGRYVALLALLELLLGLCTGGLDWVSGRHVPAYRLKAGAQGLRALLRRLLVWQLLLLLAGALLLALGAPVLAPMLALGESASAELLLRICACYLLVEGLSRALRDQYLGQLLLQGRAQAALLLRHGLWVGGCAWLAYAPAGASVLQVLVLEVLAGLLALLVAGWGLARALKELPTAPEQPDPAWQPASASQLRQLAWQAYSAFLLVIPARPQVLTLMVARMAGLEAAALYGFARQLGDQVLRFLPAELLLGFLRPVLVARYEASGDRAALLEQVSRLLMVSLLVLAPVLVLVAAQGPLVVQVLGGGRFDGSALLLALMLLGVALFSQRRMLEFVAHTTGQSALLPRASLLMLATPLLAGLMLLAAVPLPAVVVAVLLPELAFAALVARGLRRSGVPYRLPRAALGRLLLLVVAAALGLAALKLPLQPALALASQAALALALCVGLAGLLRPLDAPTLNWLRAALRPSPKEHP